MIVLKLVQFVLISLMQSPVSDDDKCKSIFSRFGKENMNDFENPDRPKLHSVKDSKV